MVYSYAVESSNCTVANYLVVLNHFKTNKANILSDKIN